MEVTARIKFDTPCLGHVRKEGCDEMLRNSESKVIFLATWWKMALRKAARALNKAHAAVEKIKPALEVEGELGVFARQWGSKATDVTNHEAFLVGTEVAVKFMLPRSLPVDVFCELLEATGTYFGMSPYGWDRDYGKFKVVEVTGGRNDPKGG